MKKKCRETGCYETADCRHGYCGRHCRRKHEHQIREYSLRSYPVSKKPHLGIEIECEFACERDRERAVSFARASKDSSLSECSAEFKLLSPKDRAVRLAKQLVHELWERGGRVSNRCGLHVHLDARQVSAVRVEELLDWAQRTQDTWFQMVPESRRNTHYIRRIEGRYDYSDHCVWMHKTHYDTVEVRLHPGTLNAHKIGGWITAMIHVMDRLHDLTYVLPNSGNAEKDFADFWIGAPAIAREYIDARLAAGGVIRDYSFQPLEEVTTDV